MSLELNPKIRRLIAWNSDTVSSKRSVLVTESLRDTTHLEAWDDHRGATVCPFNQQAGKPPECVAKKGELPGQVLPYEKDLRETVMDPKKTLPCASAIATTPHLRDILKLCLAVPAGQTCGRARPG